MPVDKGRLHKELADVQRDKGSGVTVEILDDQLSHLKGTLKGALCARRQVWRNSVSRACCHVTIRHCARV